LYNSTLNTARGLQDDEQDMEDNNNLDDDVVMLDNLDEIDMILSGTTTWTNKQDLLSAFRACILLNNDPESLE